MLGLEKCLDWNSLRIITKFFAVPTFLVKRMHRSFAIGTAENKTKNFRNYTLAGIKSLLKIGEEGFWNP